MTTSSNSTGNYRVCSICRCGFNLEVGFKKPVFACEKDPTHTWQYGYDGGPYFKHARNVGDTKPSDWVEYAF